MANHRSLNDALNLSAEKLAFIKGQHSSAAPASQTESPKTAEFARSPASPQPHVKSRKSKPEQPKNNRSKKHTQDNSTAANQHLQEAGSAQRDYYRIPITTRLQPGTADALRRAYLERKIQRRPLATQQEIIEAALQTWLREHAYLTD